MPYPKVNWQNGEAGGTPLNATNLNIMDNGIKANEDAITQNTADIEELKNKPTTALILASASPLPNTTASNIIGIDVKGKSEQKSKNLMNENNIQIGKAWNNSTSTARAVCFVSVNPNTTYTISKNGSSASVFYVEKASADSTAAIGSVVEVTTNKTLTTSATTYCIAIQYNKDGITKDDALSTKVMVEVGSSASAFEPYNPTTTNPIPIVDASGEVSAHTVNLCESNVTSTGSAKNIPLKSGTYTVSAKENLADGNWYVGAWDDSGASLTPTAISVSGMSLNGTSTWYYGKSSVQSFTFTLNVDANVRIGKQNATDSIPMQIEEGTTATDYVPFESNSISLPITLRSVGTIADTLVINSDGNGKIIQRVGTMTTADFKYYVSNGGTNSNRCVLNTDNVFLDKTQIAMCDGFVFVSGGNTAIGNDDRVGIFAFRDDQKGFTFRIDKSISTADDVKNYFREKAFTVYYPLATPIVTDLTAEQVASILALRTYNGTTIIDSELDVVSVTYSGDVKGYVDDASASMALNSKKVTRNIPSMEAGDVVYTIATPTGFPYSENFKYKAYIVQAGAFIPFKVNSVTCTSTYISISVTFPNNVSGAGTLELLLYWDEYKPIDVAPIAMIMSVDEGGIAE